MSTGHEEQTRDLFRSIALERQGYYDSKPGEAPRLSIWQQRIRRAAMRMIDTRVRAGEVRAILDAGCGRGDFTLEMAQRYPQLTEVVGCDFCRELLDLAAADAAGDPRMRFETGPLADLPLESTSVDLSVCLNVLHHVRTEQLARALSELARVSRRGLVLEIKNARSPYFKRHSRKVEGLDVFPVTIADIRDRLRPVGFELVRRHAIFWVERISPLVLLEFERSETAPAT